MQLKKQTKYGHSCQHVFFYYLARYREKYKSLLIFMHLEMPPEQANYSTTPGNALSLLFILLLKLSLPTTFLNINDSFSSLIPSY